MDIYYSLNTTFSNNVGNNLSNIDIINMYKVSINRVKRIYPNSNITILLDSNAHKYFINEGINIVITNCTNLLFSEIKIKAIEHWVVNSNIDSTLMLIDGDVLFNSKIDFNDIDKDFIYCEHDEISIFESHYKQYFNEILSKNINNISKIFVKPKFITNMGLVIINNKYIMLDYIKNYYTIKNFVATNFGSTDYGNYKMNMLIEQLVLTQTIISNKLNIKFLNNTNSYVHYYGTLKNNVEFVNMINEELSL